MNFLSLSLPAGSTGRNHAIDPHGKFCVGTTETIDKLVDSRKGVIGEFFASERDQHVSHCLPNRFPSIRRCETVGKATLNECTRGIGSRKSSSNRRLIVVGTKSAVSRALFCVGPLSASVLKVGLMETK